MLFLQKQNWRSLLMQTISARKLKQHFPSLYCTTPPNPSSTDLKKLCGVVSSSIGGLDDLEASLSKFSIPLTPSLVTQVLDSCNNEAPTRRLLRFFLWSRNNLDDKLQDELYNHAIRVFAQKKDFTAMDILISDLGKEGRKMETWTFSVVAEALVKLGREEEALGIFKNLAKFKCPQDRFAVTAIVSALCAEGHARKAEGVVWHHQDKISGAEPCIYRSLLYGWSELENVKAARRITQQMRSVGIMPDLFCYNTFLRCLCERNLKSNPSGLVPEALNVMMEMRSFQIAPTSISYNILLSCLGRTRRVKESVRILDIMRSSGCSPDWVSYYLVARVLFLKLRFGKGKQMVDKMMEDGLMPDRKFYYDLIGVLCGVEKVNYALDLFEKMKKSSLGGYGPVYDLLIPKLCRGGEFEKGRELWDEATNMGITLQCSRDVLDPLMTEVFKPVRKAKEEVNFVDYTPRSRPEVGKTIKKKNKHNNYKKKRKKAS
ncbi:pentatricopeptide repeat-containing protein At5g61370, mitochondrial [Actinidia eriantha]|uniref:pentatricopeptide repeat-containing protein At5g61370, mitochondrial n=1 Tax=Actinidia eriantha TaxID=165200 RepID=UPI002590416B|nr:pentatricopeptide repeat-containing protein At5g61370, mitochondrial [Actinidia eriantha]